MSKYIERFISNCVLLSSCVTEGKTAVDTLESGITYGHNVTAIADGLWALEMYAVNSIADPEQMVYHRTNPPQEWSFQITLEPHREKASSEILDCVKKTSGMDAISTSIVTSNSLSASLVLDLKVK